MTFIGQQFNGILAPWCFRDFPVGLFGIPVAESIMMTGDQCDVLHAGIFCRAYPLLCIEVNRVKNIDQPCIFGHADISVVHHPFSISETH